MLLVSGEGLLHACISSTRHNWQRHIPNDNLMGRIYIPHLLTHQYLLQVKQVKLTYQHYYDLRSTHKRSKFSNEQETEEHASLVEIISCFIGKTPTQCLQTRIHARFYITTSSCTYYLGTSCIYY